VEGLAEHTKTANLKLLSCKPCTRRLASGSRATTEHLFCGVQLYAFASKAHQLALIEVAVGQSQHPLDRVGGQERVEIFTCHMTENIYAPMMGTLVTTSWTHMPATATIAKRPLFSSLFCMDLSSSASLGFKLSGSKPTSPGV